MKLDTIALDDTYAREGRWDSSDIIPGVEYRTRRVWSREFVEALTRFVQAERERLGDDIDTEALNKRAVFVAIVETCFVEWRGAQGSIVDGKYVPTDDVLEYTPEVGYALFDSERTLSWEHVYHEWSTIAATSANFKAQSEAESEKKSEPSSDGNKTTDNSSNST